jgi:hypothetical protein
MASREGGAKPIVRRRLREQRLSWEPSPEFERRQRQRQLDEFERRRRRQIDRLRPLELVGERGEDIGIGLRKITVWPDEDGRILLGLVGVHGTLTQPLPRRIAADLAAALTRSLVEPAKV